MAWKPDGTAWRPSPDVMIHSKGGPEPREEMCARNDGLPALVIEVVSKTTWRYDRDLVRGKAWGYLALGIPELLLFDPKGEFLEPPCQGWRREQGTPRPWRPDAEGRFHSALGIAFQAEGMRLRVLDGQLRPLLFRREKNAALAAQGLALRWWNEPRVEKEVLIARLQEELAALRGKHSAQDG